MLIEPNTPSPRRYAAFRLRFRAILIDGGVYLAFFFVISALGAMLPEGLPAVRGALFVALFGSILLYEPLMVAAQGGTIGHKLANLRVVQTGTTRNLSVSRAVLRAIAKHPLGLFSFAFMFVTRRAQGLHDLVARSEVLIRHPDRARRRDYFVPNTSRPADGVATSTVRRIIVIVSYNVAAFGLIIVASVLLVSPTCFESDYCPAVDDQILTVLTFSWLLCMGVVVVLGWKGRLPGCRARRDAR
jgi:uncharacterized RDD family membrane protein YckC